MLLHFRTARFKLTRYTNQVNWRSLAPFEAMTTVDSGGAEIVWIPAGSLLENVLLPPNPNFDDPDAGARPVEFDYHGKPHTATTDDFNLVGGCHPL